MSKVKELPSQEYLKECFEYDDEKGVLIWKERPLSHFKDSSSMSRTNSSRIGKVAQSKVDSGYLRTTIDTVSYSTHRVMWKYHHGTDPLNQIDHIDQNKHNNRIENLRDVTVSTNGLNRTMRKSPESGTTGVYWNRNKWTSSYTVKGNVIPLGRFKNIEDAIKARKDAELKDWSHLEEKLKISHGDFELTYDYLHECFTFNYETGELKWKERDISHFKDYKAMRIWNARFANVIIKRISEAGYVTVSINKKQYNAHRLIYWMWYNCNPEGLVVDHASGVRTDNRIENLRLCTRADNAMNKKSENGKLKGACFDKSRGKWISMITLNGKSKYLGRFETELEAHAAYCKAATELHKEYANFGN